MVYCEGCKIGTTGAVSQYLILFLTQSTSRTGFAITTLSSLNLFLYVNADVYYEKFSLIKLSEVGWFVVSTKTILFYREISLVPRPLPAFNVDVEKRESLVREITYANRRLYNTT